MNILHLTLKRVWFDAIARGEKKEEYRLRSPHWRRKLEFEQDLLNRSARPLFRTFNQIHFRNGYNLTCPFMRVACRGIHLGTWEGRECYVIALGEILEITNWKRVQT